MLHGRFFADHLGKPIREWMFKKAAELDPDADMFLNDFDVVENGQLTEVNNHSPTTDHDYNEVKISWSDTVE